MQFSMYFHTVLHNLLKTSIVASKDKWGKPFEPGRYILWNMYPNLRMKSLWGLCIIALRSWWIILRWRFTRPIWSFSPALRIYSNTLFSCSQVFNQRGTTHVPEYVPKVARRFQCAVLMVLSTPTLASSRRRLVAKVCFQTFTVLWECVPSTVTAKLLRYT